MKRTLTWRYALIVATYWIGFSTVSAFASLYLLDAGFSNTFIGVLLAVSGVCASVTQPIVSTRAEKPNSPSLKRIACGLSLLIAVASVLVRVSAPLSKALIVPLYGCSLMLLHTLQPIVNAIGMETLNRGERLNFSASRASGAVGYGVISYGMGFLAAKYTPSIVPIASALCFGALALLAALYPQPKRPVATVVAARGGDGAIDFFRRYKRFGLVLIGCTLALTSHTIINVFNLQVITAKGGGSVEMGTATLIAACFEIPGMLLFAKFIKRLRCDTLLVISSAFFTLKCLGSLLAQSVPVYYAVQLCQLLGWGLFAVVSVRYTNSVMRPEDAVKGQGYCTVAQSLATVIGTTVGGRLMDVSGVNAMLAFGVGAAVIGTVMVAAFTEKVTLRNASN